MSAAERVENSEPATMRTARAMIAAGYRPIPIYPGKKKPIGEGWGLILHTPEKWRDPTRGLGVLLGDDGSGGGLIDFEIDDSDLAGPVIDRIFPDGIPDTPCFAANLGMHYVFRYDRRLAKYGQTIVKGEIDPTTGVISHNPHYLGVEFRIGTIDPAHPVQEQSVIPPTPRADGSPREWMLGDGELIGPDTVFAGPLRFLPLPECVFADLDRYAVPGTRSSTTPEADSGPSWDKEEVKAAILPHAKELAIEWGLRITGTRATSKGFLECRAIDRTDSEPSCGFSPTTGVYTDRKTGTDLSIFQLALALRAYPDFPSCINTLGRRFKVSPRSGNPNSVNAVNSVSPNNESEPEDSPEWVGPVTRSDLAAEPFPLDVFPPPLGDLCRQGALSLHCPPDYFAVAALGIAGGAMGRSVALKVKSTWEVYGNLFVAVVGAPGSKKSPAQKIVSRPLWILDRELRARHKEELAEHRNRSKGGADAGDLPTRDHAVIDDATREAFVKALSENSRGLIVVKDELTAWVASLNAYKPSGRGDDKQFWMSLNSNAPVKVNRKMNQDDFLIYPSFGSVVGCLTPGTLPMIRESKADDGWIDRILFSYPEPLPLARRWTDAEISRDILDDWTQAVRRLFSRPMVRDDDGHDRPSFVGLDADAHVQWESWYNAHNAEQCVPNFPGYLLGPWSKLEGFTLRFALILSQLRQAYDPRGGGEPRDIDVLVMRDAFRLTAYFKNHFRRARGELIRRPDGLTHDARDVIQWLRDHPRDSFTGRDVLRRFPQFDDHDRDDAISSLISQRYIRRCPTPPRPPGKRGQSPSPVYEVNPSLFRADRIDCIDGIPSDDCHDSNSVNRVNSVSPKNGSVNGTPPSTVAPSPRVLTWLVCFLTFKPASAGRVAEEACRESIGREELDAAAGVLGIERFVEDGIEHWKLTTT